MFCNGDVYQLFLTYKKWKIIEQQVINVYLKKKKTQTRNFPKKNIL